MIDTSMSGSKAGGAGAGGQPRAEHHWLMIFVEQLIDLIVNKNLIGHTELNLMQRIMKQQGRRQLALDNIKYSFNAQGLQSDLNNKKYTLPDFVSVDDLNAQAMHAHSLLNQTGHLVAMRSYRAVEVFEGLGGFKLMYPLVHFIMKSNLKELDPERPGQLSGTLLAKIFQVLDSLLLERPQHIQVLMNQRNLFFQLKHCLLTLGKKHYLTGEVLSKLTEIVTNNIIALYQYKKVKSRVIETQHEPAGAAGQPVPAGATRKTYHEETVYELQKKQENNLKQVKEMRSFYQQFLSYFVHILLLDKQFVFQKYYSDKRAKVLQGLSSDDSSGPHQAQQAPRAKKELVLKKIVNMMHSICCPMQLRKQILVTQQISEREALYENDGDHSLSVSYEMEEGNNKIEADKSQKSGHEDVTEGIFTSYVDLRQFIVSEKTVSQLLEFLNCQAVYEERQKSTLSKLGQSIASAIVFSGSNRHVSNIVSQVQNDRDEIGLARITVLLDILKHICHICYQSKEQSVAVERSDAQGGAPNASKLGRILTAVKELKFDTLVGHFRRFYSQDSRRHEQIDELIATSDSLVAKMLQLKLTTANKKAQYEDFKRDLSTTGSVASFSSRAFNREVDASSLASNYPSPAQPKDARGTPTSRDTAAALTGPQMNPLQLSMRDGAAGQVDDASSNWSAFRSQGRQRGLSNAGQLPRPEIFGSSVADKNFALISQLSNAGDEAKLPSEVTMQALYAKQTFKREVQRMQEDSSSIWYDHQELELLEYQEMGEAYDRLKRNAADTALSVEQQQEELFRALLEDQPDPARRTRMEERREKQKQMDEVIVNPSHLVPSYSYTIAHQKLGFVTQRRIVDKWGRMMLLKPNRKYFAEKSNVLFDYHAHDYMDQMLALSLLKDEDYDDLVIPEAQYQRLVEQRSNPQEEQPLTPRSMSSLQAQVRTSDESFAVVITDNDHDKSTEAQSKF